MVNSVGFMKLWNSVKQRKSWIFTTGIKRCGCWAVEMTGWKVMGQEYIQWAPTQYCGCAAGRVVLSQWYWAQAAYSTAWLGVTAPGVVTRTEHWAVRVSHWQNNQRQQSMMSCWHGVDYANSIRIRRLQWRAHGVVPISSVRSPLQWPISPPCIHDRYLPLLLKKRSSWKVTGGCQNLLPTRLCCCCGFFFFPLKMMLAWKEGKPLALSAAKAF